MNFLEEISFAVKRLWKNPGFVTVVVLTLALGIGATSAVFSVVNGVMLKPLPYPEPNRVVYVGWQWAEGGTASMLSPIKYDFAREHSTSFEAFATAQPMSVELEHTGGPSIEVQGQSVSRGWFQSVGALPAQGRAFMQEENSSGGPRVVILSHRIWHSSFDANPNIIGQTARLNDEPYRIVGVMPADFIFVDTPDWADFFVPLQLTVDPRDGGHRYMAIARLQSGVTREQAALEMQRVTERLREQYPGSVADNASGRFIITDYQALLVGKDLRRTLWVLLGAVVLYC